MRTSLVVLGLAALLTLSIVPATAPAVPVAAVPAFPVVYRDAGRAMIAAGAPYANWAAAGRRFLSFDTHGDGTAVEVLGDLATADRMAVLVPGVDTTLADFDRGLGGVAGHDYYLVPGSATLEAVAEVVLDRRAATVVAR